MKPKKKAKKLLTPVQLQEALFAELRSMKELWGSYIEAGRLQAKALHRLADAGEDAHKTFAVAVGWRPAEDNDSPGRMAGDQASATKPV